MNEKYNNKLAKIAGGIIAALLQNKAAGMVEELSAKTFANIQRDTKMAIIPKEILTGDLGFLEITNIPRVNEIRIVTAEMIKIII